MISFEEQIAALTLKREINKQQLFEKEALRLRNKELFLVYGERIDIKERIALDSEIAHLEADRQRTKVELLKLKMLAKERRGETLMQLLMSAMQRNGLQHEIDLAKEQASEILKREGLHQAYTSNI